MQTSFNWICVILQHTVPAAGKRATRVGNIGHITRIANKLVYLAHNQNRIQACLQVSFEWDKVHAFNNETLPNGINVTKNCNVYFELNP